MGTRRSRVGVELVTKLQSVRYPAGIIVFLASMENNLVERYEQLGVKGILRKPLTLSDLSECLQAIGAAKARDRTSAICKGTKP